MFKNAYFVKKRVYNKKPVANKRGPNKQRTKLSGKEQSGNKMLEYFSGSENDMSNDEQGEKERSQAAKKQPCITEQRNLQDGTKSLN